MTSQTSPQATLDSEAAQSRIIKGSCLDEIPKLEKASVQCVVTSPPYFQMRTYGESEKEIGRENSPWEYIQSIVRVLDLIRPILKDDGVIWLNIGDSFAATSIPATEHYPAIAKGEQLMVPAMLALEIRRLGYHIQQDVIWHKRNPMPNPTRRRCVPSHEYIWMISKTPRYTFDPVPIEEEASWQGASNPLFGGNKRAGGDNPIYTGRPYVNTGKRRKRDVWHETTSKCKEAHFAPFPESIVRPAILATTKPGDTVLDPFSGSGTTGRVAAQENRSFIGIELYQEYIDLHTM